VLNAVRLAFAAPAIVAMTRQFAVGLSNELGYDGVLARSVGLAIGFTLAGSVLLWIGNRRALDPADLHAAAGRGHDLRDESRREEAVLDDPRLGR
jgi:hypothetical protein